MAIKRNITNKKIKNLSEIEEKQIKEDTNKIEKKQLIWIAGIMIVLLVLLGAFYLIKTSSDKVDYLGLEFDKIKFGEIPLYYAQIPMKTITGDVVANYNWYLRNNPKELENISIDGSIRLLKNAIISIDNNVNGCEDNNIAGVNLGMFLNTAGIDLSTGSTNKTYSKEKNITYANCDNVKNGSVIIIQKGEENKITQANENCYVLEFKDCDIVRVTEKFSLGVYGHSRGYFI